MNPKPINLGRPTPGFFVRRAPVYALCALLATPATSALAQNAAPPAGGDGKVNVTDYGGVSMSVQDTDLATVLQMLSIDSKQNIIVGKSVSGTVSVNLYDVSFDDALKAILEPNGYTYYREGNFIYVITREEKEALDKAKRKTESRIFELEYLSAADATEFILPLLSDAGKAAGRGDVAPGIKPDVSDAGGESYAFNAKLVVTDYAENLEAVARLIEELDTAPQQVLVESTILSTDLDETNAFGVDFTVLGSLNFTDLTSPLGAVADLVTGELQPDDNKAQAITSTVGGTQGPGGLKVGIVSDDISVFLRVLDEVTDSTVLARPKIMALNRQKAQVLVGARVGYLSTTATDTTTTQTVEFLDTGIELIFRPFISRNGMVRLELSPSVSEASLRSITDANGLIVTIPDELTNEITTNVRVKDGETVVLGGLFKETNKTTRRQVPVLGDIPIVGTAFRGQDDQVSRQEIMFLITPSVVKDEVLWASGKQVMDSIDSIRVGARAGLLPFSNDKLTANYNQKAVDAYNRGDMDAAMHNINNSLRLLPDQPEMIRLREKISGEKARVNEKSLMERAFHKEIIQANPPVVMNSRTSAQAVASMNQPGEWGQAQASVNMSATFEPIAEATSPSMMSDESTDESSMTVTGEEMEFQPGTNDLSFSGEQSMESPMSDMQMNWQGESTESCLSPAQKQFYTSYLAGLFTTLGMPEIAACFTPDGNDGQEIWSAFPAQDMTSATFSQQSPE